MDAFQLEQLGLRAEEGPGGLQATLELAEGFVLENPVTHQHLPSVTFRLVSDRLVPIAPPAVVGLPPILLASVRNRAEISLHLSTAYDEHLFHLERRSSQLQTMGLQPKLDPETLQLSTELETGPLEISLVTDRQGQFRVGRVLRDGRELTGLPPFRFELFEFRNREVLASYLVSLIDERLARPQIPAPGSPGLVRYEELARLFGAQAVVPPRSPVELLVQVQVHGEPYRFAAARVQGRTFRGLLAGTRGKVWAERFELDDFPGIVRLVADLLKVSPEAVKVLGPDSPQE